MDTHREVIAWTENHAIRGTVTVRRSGEELQSGRIMSAHWPDGRELSTSELSELSTWVSHHWDPPDF